MALERRLVEGGRVERTRRRSGLDGVVEPVTGGAHRLRHRAVEQPRIEVPQPVMGGEPLAERALAGSRGPRWR